MHPTLKKYLEKLGLKSYNDLNELEKETFREWESILERGSLTDEEVTEQLENFFNKILDGLEDPDASEKRISFLRSQMKVVRYILGTINSPKAEVKQVENEINSLTRW